MKYLSSHIILKYIPAILHEFGLMLFGFGISLLLPSLVGIFESEYSTAGYFLADGISIGGIGFLLWYSGKHKRYVLSPRDSFLLVGLICFVMPMVATLPMLQLHGYESFFRESWFEANASFTTTGWRLLADWSQFSRAEIFYRALLQALGGLIWLILWGRFFHYFGKIQKFNHYHDDNAQRQIKYHSLWKVYVVLLVLCAVNYWLAGMGIFDAICHAFSTISGNGLTQYRDNIGHFHSSTIEMITMLFMFSNLVNLSLHAWFWQTGSLLKSYYRDEEMRAGMGLLILLLLFLWAICLFSPNFPDISTAARQSLFMLLSYASNTAHFVTATTEWQGYAPILLLIASYLLAHAGSMGGGLKMVRVLILFKQSWREMNRLLYPQAALPIKLNQHTIPESIISAISGLVTAYLAMAIGLTCFSMIILPNIDFLSAFHLISGGLTNSGLIHGTPLYQIEHSIALQWLLVFTMLLGKLEIFGFLILFSPRFWR